MTSLGELPGRMDRMESQLLQLRTEMRDEFSAVRTEIRSGDEETRRELRQEIRSGNEETRHYMRVLFEDYVGRLRVIDEGKSPNT